MIQNSKYFTYNNISLSSFEGMRIGTESSNMYSVNIISERRILEEKIVGRKAPYFYGVDDDPLTLEITVALEKPKPISELRQFFRWIFSPKEYKQLSFDSDPNKFYYAIFVGSPELRYIDMSKSTDIDNNNRKLIGYITLTARCNAGTAFGPAISLTEVNQQSNVGLLLVNNGDENVFPSIRIKMGDVAFPDSLPFISLSIDNPENNSKIEFAKVYRNEEIIVDMSIRRITATGSAVPHNIYESWARNYLELEVGSNQLFIRPRNPNTGEILNTFVSAQQPYLKQVFMEVEFTYQPVRYI